MDFLVSGNTKPHDGGWLADGVTVENAAREPEIGNLAILLNEMGAKVGASTRKQS